MLCAGVNAAAREPRIEVRCPAPPAVVNAESKPVLVYELQITSFESVALTLKTLEIFGDSAGKVPLATYSGAALSPILDLIGPAPAGQPSDTIGPGQRAVVYLWIAVNPSGPAPSSLRHRLVFTRIFNSSEKPDEETALDKFEVKVNPGPPVVLSPPFSGGIWLAGNGPSNTSDHRRTLVALDGGAFIAQRFAIDWVKIGANGDTTHDGKDRNENYWGYGEPVHAVADGEVTEIVNDIPDNTPHHLPADFTLQNIAGNHVIIKIAPELFVTFAHLQPGSIKPRVGEHVRRGDVIALLGDSGNTTGPHLHLQVTNGNSVLGSEGVPFVFDKYQFLGPGADYPEKQVSEPRVRSLPVENSVVKFGAGN
ncbi:MAG TPA: M23 family metallopeptidase [Candidatus Acidoferrales bacterium]|nr:M23 family metallopeptidase [Candidatus Acidoferrales bacterium]